jgi:hypothetical protein
MKISYTLEKADVKAAFELYLCGKGHPVQDSDDFTINPDGTATVLVTQQVAATKVQTVVPKASTAAIGTVVDGVKITHYGYPGDSSPDSQSMKGVGDRGNRLKPNLSVAMTRAARSKFFGVESPSTGKEFSLAGSTFRDDDSAPESDPRVDVYDPFYTGIDAGCTPAMYAKSRSEMVAAGILA